MDWTGWENIMGTHQQPGAGSVRAARPDSRQAGGGSTPTPALHELKVKPVPLSIAKSIIVEHHYLKSMPGGTKLAFGAFVGSRLLGALTLGVGPLMVFRLVEGAKPEDCVTLTRLWLSDELPVNSESRVIGSVLRALRRSTSLKFVVSYADPAAGHHGGIYQATNWLHIGLPRPPP